MRGQNRMSSTSSNARNTTKVIILSYMRSGSSLLGELFNTNDDALYVFEPLWYLCVKAVPAYEQLVYLNGTVRYPDTSCQDLGRNILESFLTCDIENIDVGTLSAAWHLEKSLKLQKLASCGPKPTCIKDLVRTCQKTAVRAAKIIRVRLSDLKPLLVKYPELKVIHLVRDPRGILHSRIEIKEYYRLNPLVTAEEICGNMKRDSETFKQFRVFFPGRVFQLRYEDFSSEPLLYTEQIFKFLNLSVPARTKAWVVENTHRQTNGAFDTSRNDSLKTAYRWRHLIPMQTVEAMIGPCKTAYDELLYVDKMSERELRDKNFPLRLEMCSDNMPAVSTTRAMRWSPAWRLLHVSKISTRLMTILISRAWLYLVTVLTLGAVLTYLFTVHCRQPLLPVIPSQSSQESLSVTTPRNVPKIDTEDSAKKVIILSYMRSGTSLMGKLFDENDEALYIFEPMWYLCIVAVPGFRQIQFLNGTKWHPPPSCSSIGLREVESYLTCDVREITTGSLSQFWMQNARRTNTFYRCGLKPDCIEAFAADCKQAPLRAVKVINLRVDHVTGLLDKYSNLRIIHLVRDPRGMIQSRIPMKEYYYYSPTITASSLCGDMLRDVRAFHRLSRLYPQQLLQIRYEDFAESPLQYTEKIYHFLGFALPGKVKKWVQENTHAQAQDSSGLGTARANSSETAYKWRKSIAWDLTLAMDDMCKRVYKALGYVEAKSEKMLRNWDTPLKVPLNQHTKHRN
ncbi:uncharacterized protein LOC135477136 [Liolophura sinensis]|uniref:uncharacterized protein LOC135477136 n=1 Tax=Liolophura sinensis TaxID=3198878 RepID=UPI0031597DBC